MNRIHQATFFVGALLGGLVTLPVLAKPASAQQALFSVPQQNPLDRTIQADLLGGDRTTPITQVPLPESVNVPVANVTPTSGRVTVRLRNNTNAIVNYQVIEHTAPRELAGRSEVNLQNLPAPVTITLNREDNGLLQVIPTVTQSEPGVLEILLEESTALNDNQSAIRIQVNGSVYLN